MLAILAMDLRRMAACAVAALGLEAAAQHTVHEIPTRPGVTVRALYAPAEAPRAGAVLLQGGHGSLGLFPNGSMREGGFLASGAGRFASLGVSVLVADAPSDRRTLSAAFRASPEHAQDLAGLIAFLRARAAAPVWLVGTSNGALSAANGAARLGREGPDGIVLTSTLTREGLSRGLAHVVTSASLAQVQVPTLLLHHRDDPCHVTPADALPALAAAFTATPRAEVVLPDGGTPGNACAGGLHQFSGIEDLATRRIVDWMLPAR